MPELSDHYAFEKFPREDLLFKVNRHQFFQFFATEYKVKAGQSQGGVAFKLSKLGSLPDEYLGELAPVIVAECNISELNGYIWGQLPSGQPLKLFPVDSPALNVFNCFDGLISLNIISCRLAQEMGWETSRSFAFARGVFLYLVTLRMCLPK